MEHNAGYAILQTECYSTQPNGEENHICLGKMPGKEMYVTWEARRHPKGHWDYFWGHYTPNRVAAYLDYHRRLADNYNRQEG